MLFGTGNLKGLADMERVTIVGGADNPLREGLVSIAIKGVPTVEAVTKLNEAGIRTHTRKADHYSGNILDPMGLDSCIRVSMCHYNTLAEVAQFLTEIRKLAED